MAEIYALTTAEQLKPGDQIKLVEIYNSATITYEGAVRDVEKTLIEINLDSELDSFCSAYARDTDDRGVKVEIWLKVELPTVPGSIIEVHDKSSARDVRVMLDASGTWHRLLTRTSDIDAEYVSNQQVESSFKRVIFVP